MDYKKPDNEWSIVKYTRPYQFIPPWGMVFMLVTVSLYVIITSGKFHIIQRDLREPRFLVIMGLIFLFLFFVKDKNIKRSKYANDHAIVAGIAAYFGHLDMPLVAVFLAGTYSYYTFYDYETDSTEATIQGG